MELLQDKGDISTASYKTPILGGTLLIYFVHLFGVSFFKSSVYSVSVCAAKSWSVRPPGLPKYCTNGSVICLVRRHWSQVWTTLFVLFIFLWISAFWRICWLAKCVEHEHFVSSELYWLIRACLRWLCLIRILNYILACFHYWGG